MSNSTLSDLFEDNEASNTLALKRLETSRLFHRFGFGPRPGEFAKALKEGIGPTCIKLLNPPTLDSGASKVSPPEITDLGKRPAPNSSEVIPFATALRSQSQDIVLWWLDLMTLSDHGLTERMTWFWHGHWATSIEKIKYSLPIYIQNNTLRTHSLGDFNKMTKAMLNDGALQLWLDGQENTAKAPNENLGRELMELFLLGVNRYTEEDVKAIARALTGYQVNRSSGLLTIKQRRRDTNPVTLLGKTSVFTGDTLSEFLVARDDAATFISERLWYRFISSTEPMPFNFSAKTAFASRDIKKTITAVATDPAMSNKKYALVKSPVEWLISSCRALELTPSALRNPLKLINYLNKLGQTPFSPPNVSGWPAGEAWLSSASAQFRLSFATWLIKQSKLTVLKQLPPQSWVEESKNWLGIAEWSPRTKLALQTALDDPKKFALLALCSPEYVVNA